MIFAASDLDSRARHEVIEHTSLLHLATHCMKHEDLVFISPSREQLIRHMDSFSVKATFWVPWIEMTDPSTCASWRSTEFLHKPLHFPPWKETPPPIPGNSSTDLGICFFVSISEPLESITVKSHITIARYGSSSRNDSLLSPALRGTKFLARTLCLSDGLLNRSAPCTVN